jgi:molybdopterin converting factor small subunit
MKVTVELTYDMAKALGARRFDLEGAETVAEAVRLTRARFGDQAEAFDQLTRVTALVLNGVLVQYRKGADSPLTDGDTLSFLKAAAGG